MTWNNQFGWLLINNKFSDSDSMTEEFYKKVYQNTYLTNNFRLRILGNKEKFHIEWRQVFLLEIIFCQ